MSENTTERYCALLYFSVDNDNLVIKLIKVIKKVFIQL